MWISILPEHLQSWDALKRVRFHLDRAQADFRASLEASASDHLERRLLLVARQALCLALAQVVHCVET